MKRLNVALLSGGSSSERDVSIKSGNQVYEALDKAKYNVTRHDPATDLGKLVASASRIDVALIILHGPYGEDGTVQGLLDLFELALLLGRELCAFGLRGRRRLGPGRLGQDQCQRQADQG